MTLCVDFASAKAIQAITSRSGPFGPHTSIKEKDNGQTSIYIIRHRFWDHLAGGSGLGLEPESKFLTDFSCDMAG
jgi:hypothetical protein